MHAGACTMGLCALAMRGLHWIALGHAQQCLATLSHLHTPLLAFGCHFVPVCMCASVSCSGPAWCPTSSLWHACLGASGHPWLPLAFTGSLWWPPSCSGGDKMVASMPNCLQTAWCLWLLCGQCSWLKENHGLGIIWQTLTGFYKFWFWSPVLMICIASIFQPSTDGWRPLREAVCDHLLLHSDNNEYLYTLATAE